MRGGSCHASLCPCLNASSSPGPESRPWRPSWRCATSAGRGFEIDLLAPSHALEHRPASVAAPFGLGAPPPLDLHELARRYAVTLVEGQLAGVDVEARNRSSRLGRRSHRFDYLLVAVGAKPGRARPGLADVPRARGRAGGRVGARRGRARPSPPARRRRPARGHLVASGVRAGDHGADATTCGARRDRHARDARARAAADLRRGRRSGACASCSCEREIELRTEARAAHRDRRRALARVRRRRVADTVITFRAWWARGSPACRATMRASCPRTRTAT